MALSVKRQWKNIKWRQLLTTELTTSWKPSLQAAVLLYIAEMLQEGFHLIDICRFLMIIFPKQVKDFEHIAHGFSKGQHFYELVGFMKIKGNIVYQIKVAESFGQFGQSLEEIALYIQEQDLHIHRMRSVMLYPLMLMVLMVAMMFGLRIFLLPQLAAFTQNGDSGILGNLIFFLEHLPEIASFAVMILTTAVLIYYLWRKRTDPLKRAQVYVKIPGFGFLFRLYYTQFFAYEFSQLFKLGYSVQQIISSLKQQDEVPFLHAFGVYLERQYLQGIVFSDSLKEIDVFANEFPAVVMQGELLNQLAVKTRLYSQRTLKRLYQEIDKKIKLTQSVLFLTVAISVVVVYLILMLPMLTMLESI
jgi:competence protein ComGB